MRRKKNSTKKLVKSNKTQFEEKIENLFERITAFIVKVAKKYLSNDLPIFAGGAAFFLIVSSIPIFMLMFSTIALIPSLNVEDFIQNINLLFPNVPYITNVMSYIMNVARQLASTSVIYTNIITSLITGSTCLFSFIVGIRKVYEIKHTSNYLLLKFMTIINIFVLYFSIIFTMIFFVLGGLLFEYVERYIPFAANILSGILHYKYLTVGTALIVLTSSLYTCCSNFNRKYSQNMYGAVFTTVTWLFISNLFSMYYGSLPINNAFESMSGIILALIWLFICINLVFIGACINQVVYEHKTED